MFETTNRKLFNNKLVNPEPQILPHNNTKESQTTKLHFLQQHLLFKQESLIAMNGKCWLFPCHEFSMFPSKNQVYNQVHKPPVIINRLFVMITIIMLVITTIIDCYQLIVCVCLLPHHCLCRSTHTMGLPVIADLGVPRAIIWHRTSPEEQRGRSSKVKQVYAQDIGEQGSSYQLPCNVYDHRI